MPTAFGLTPAIDPQNPAAANPPAQSAVRPAVWTVRYVASPVGIFPLKARGNRDDMVFDPPPRHNMEPISPWVLPGRYSKRSIARPDDFPARKKSIWLTHLTDN